MGSGTRDILVLSRIPGVGSHRLRALLSHFGDPALVASATARELVAVEGIDRKTAAMIALFFRGPGASEAGRFADDQCLRAEKLGARIVSIGESAYPRSLHGIYDPPPFLFVRGTLEERDAFSVAIVGTRNPSPYGLQMAERFALALARLGIPVVSGLARGIDTASHAASIRSSNRTLAVIGSGLDIMYPPENKSLAERIATSGAVLSEFPLGTKPDGVNFPRRNRIVSGISLATLVIETRPGGGAMITAGIALEQGREVFAVPASVSDRRASGTNLLIKEGKAKLTESVEDILVELAPRLSPILPPRPPRQPEVNLFEQRVLDAIEETPLHVDVLAFRAGFPVSDALVHLLALEFKGAVKQLPGKRFVRL